MNMRQVTMAMRWVHLYTSLLLWPWMVVYAISGLALNHGNWLREHFASVDPAWAAVRQVELGAGESFGTGRDEQADAILARAGLTGMHYISPDGGDMAVIRRSGGGDYRVTWKQESNRLIVERKPFSFFNWVNFLHFQRYNSSYWASIAWGAVVDAVTISTLLWVISGIWLWAMMPKKRLWGGICIAAGMVLFIILAACFMR